MGLGKNFSDVYPGLTPWAKSCSARYAGLVGSTGGKLLNATLTD